MAFSDIRLYVYNPES